MARKILRFAKWLLVAVIAAVGVQVGLLAFPQVLLRNTAEAGSVVVFYDGDPEPGVQELAKEADSRLRASGFGNSTDPRRVYFFRDPGLYYLFARLARVPVTAQGFGISLLGTSYVSGPRVKALGERSGGGPRFSVWEGDVVHTMVHEVAHSIMVDSIGRSVWKALPQWKQEGYPEYISNIGLIRADSADSLSRRIETLLDDDQWIGPRSWDRIHYEAGLLMEFLLDIQGLELGSVLAENITREETYGAMLGWSAEIPQPPDRITSTAPSGRGS
jgi:hypothetical protein